MNGEESFDYIHDTLYHIFNSFIIIITIIHVPRCV